MVTQQGPDIDKALKYAIPTLTRYLLQIASREMMDDGKHLGLLHDLVD